MSLHSKLGCISEHYYNTSLYTKSQAEIVFAKELRFKCQLCKKSYRHWICKDLVWNNLPEEIRSMMICTHCFECIRGLKRNGIMKNL